MSEVHHIAGQQLLQALFSQVDRCCFAVLDGASIETLLDRIHELEPDYECLYAGELEPDILETAPYLVRLEADHMFTHWLLGEGWGKHYGVFFRGPMEIDIRSARQHFRKLVTVQTPDNQVLNFRFYDPRVLRTFLPTCSADQMSEIFGPFEMIQLEGEQPQQMLTFHDGRSQWMREVVTLKHSE